MRRTRSNRYCTSIALQAALAASVACSAPAPSTPASPEPAGAHEGSSAPPNAPTLPASAADPGPDAPPAETGLRSEPSGARTWPVPTLDGITWDRSVGSVLAACTVAEVGGYRPNHLPAPLVDLDQDGQTELVLFNMACTDASGARVDHPILRVNPATARLEVVGTLLDRIGDTVLQQPFSAAGFADLDHDGDADLLATMPRLDADPAVVWLQNATGALRVRPMTVLDHPGSQPALTNAALGFADVDGDGVVEGVVPFLLPGDAPSDARFGLVDVGPQGGVGVTASWLEHSAGRVDWAVAPVSLEPDRDPWAWTWLAQSRRPTADDDLYTTARGTKLPDDTLDVRIDPMTGAPQDAAIFLEPVCGSRSTSCLTPMGATSVWVPDDADDDGPLPATWSLCFLVSTGIYRWPVGVFCDDGSGAHLHERGALADAMAPPAEATTTLSWQIVPSWDLNADGFSDLIVTMGRDASVYAPMPTLAYLQTPGCASDTCPRWARTEIPGTLGHHYALETLPVQLADGSWRVLAFLSTDVHPVDPSITLDAFWWTPPPGHHWLALQLGDRHDLRAIGATVHVRRFDAAGQPVAGTERLLHALQPTRSTPGSNSPILLGVAPGTTRIELEIDLPRCHPTVTVDVTAFDQPVTVDVPPCP
jgi:hypothetical protein